MEEGAALVVLLQVEVFLCGGGAPRSSGAALPLHPCSQLCGVAVRGSPFAGFRGTADLASTTLCRWLVELGSAMMASAGVGPLRPAIGDFPSARGMLSFQGFEESRSGGAPPTAPWTASWPGCRKDGAVILFFVGSFL